MNTRPPHAPPSSHAISERIRIVALRMRERAHAILARDPIDVQDCRDALAHLHFADAIEGRPSAGDTSEEDELVDTRPL